MSNENKIIRLIPKDDPIRNIIIQRPIIIYNHKTGDSYVTLEINVMKEYILKNDYYLNERSIIKKMYINLLRPTILNFNVKNIV